ncbi:MAG TPA: hypothetical protein VNE84_06985 [Candidatus Limnocylindria bacterium]|nr:hypothetical protein [Candidatus Limnocylindria bacterium]
MKNEQIAATAKASFREFFFSRSHDAVIRVYDQAGNVRDARARGRFQRVVKQRAATPVKQDD